MRHESSGRFENSLKNKLRIMAFALSLCIFCTGTFSLAHALQNASAGSQEQIANQESGTRDETTAATDTSQVGESTATPADATDSISSDRLQADESFAPTQAPESAGETQSKTSDDSKSNNGTNPKKESTSKAKSKPKTKTKPKAKVKSKSKSKSKAKPKAKASKKSVGSTTDAAAKRTKLVKHSASRKVPVYKNEKHTARRAIKKTVNETTIVTYVNCKTCGKAHAKSYSKKVLSHYKTTSCKACGKSHDHAYTETVSLE